MSRRYTTSIKRAFQNFLRDTDDLKKKAFFQDFIGYIGKYSLDEHFGV